MISNKIGINADAVFLNGDLGSLEDALDNFEEVGFEAVEIPIHGTGTLLNGELNEESLEILGGLVGQYNFKYTVHAPDLLSLGTKKNIETHIEVFKSTIKFASFIDAEIVVYHTSLQESDDSREREKENLNDLSTFCERQKVTVAVENMWNSDPDNLIHLVQEVESGRVKICYDLGHAFIYSNQFDKDFLYLLEKVKPELAHVHLHDNFGKKLYPEDFEKSNIHSHLTPYIHKAPFGLGDLHLPLGEGTLPLTEIFEALQDYSGVWLLEIDPRFAGSYENAFQLLRSYLN